MKSNNNYRRYHYNQNKYSRRPNRPRKTSIISYLIPFLLLWVIIFVGFNFLKNNPNEELIVTPIIDENTTRETGLVLKDVLGDVSFVSAGNTQESGAFNNLKLKEGDKIKSEQGYFTLNIFDRFILRANKGVVLNILALDNEAETIDIQLEKGQVWGRVLNYSANKEAKFKLVAPYLGIEANEVSFSLQADLGENPSLKIFDGDLDLFLYEEVSFKEPLSATLVAKTFLTKDQKTEIIPADFAAIKKKSKMLELHIIENIEKEEDRWYLKNMQADQTFLTRIKEKSKINIQKLKENESWLEVLIWSETADDIEQEKLIYYKVVGILREFPEIKFIEEELKEIVINEEEITSTENIKSNEEEETTDLSSLDLFEYEVQAGDGLVALAERFEVEWEKLAEVNNLEYPYDLLLGQKLLIPNKKGITTELTFSKEEEIQEETESKELIENENKEELLPQQDNYIRYTVAPGDSLSKIASKYSLTWQEIVKVNYIEEPYPLSVGQTLVIPINQWEENNSKKEVDDKYKDMPTFDYQVEPGENLGIIARKFGVEIEDIINLSKLEDENYLFVGQNLKIPQTKTENGEMLE